MTLLAAYCALPAKLAVSVKLPAAGAMTVQLANPATLVVALQLRPSRSKLTNTPSIRSAGWALTSLRVADSVRVPPRAPPTTWLLKLSAVLRKPGRLVLIDATGHELEPVSPERAKGKLIVFGPGASKQVEALTKLLGAAPALKPQVTEAEWVGNRRWNVAFKTGQILALPEGEKDAANSLMTFARLDGVNRLLGGKVAVFDMRTAGRIYFRVPERATDAATATAKAAAAKAAAKTASADTKDTKDTKVASAKSSNTTYAVPR